MVQCGDPSGTGAGVEPGYTIPDELTRRGPYKAGSLAMANTGQPNTGGGQFFIITGPNGAALPTKYCAVRPGDHGLDDTVKAMEAGRRSQCGQRHADEGEDRHQQGDDHRELTSGQRRERRLAAIDHHLHVAARRPCRVFGPHGGGAGVEREYRDALGCEFIRATGAVVAPVLVVGNHGEGGHERQAEGERAARGSTIGSDNTIAPAEAPATTAPSCHAATIASHTGVSFSTERTCIGEPPAR